MLVNSNFMNFARLVLTFNRIKKIETNLNLDSNLIILDYSMINAYNLNYINNDNDYHYSLEYDSINIIMNESCVLIDLFNSNDESFKIIKPEVKETFFKIFNDILLDDKYDSVLMYSTFLNSFKFKALNDKLQYCISIEDYEKCSEIKYKISILKEITSY